jgi:hypothetical protein
MVLNSTPPLLDWTSVPVHTFVSTNSVSTMYMRDDDSMAYAWQPISMTTPRISPLEEFVMCAAQLCGHCARHEPRWLMNESTSEKSKAPSAKRATWAGGGGGGGARAEGGGGGGKDLAACPRCDSLRLGENAT